jgi:predicted ferric reductase
MNLIFRGILWFGLYVALVLLPLGIALTSDVAPSARPRLVEFGVAIGFVAFTVMAFEFALVGRLKAAADPFGVDALMQFHRQMGLAAFVFVLAHVAAIAGQGFSWSMLDPFGASRELQSGAIALWALVLLAASSIFRRRLRLPYEIWQFIHALAAITIVIASLVHVLAVGRYLGDPALRVVLIAYVALFLALMLRYRLLRPLRLWRRPWAVIGNRDEGGDTRTLAVESVGHDGVKFEPGQFVWLSTARHPFAIEQHPISIASSAEQSRMLELSIKALGDWSREIVPNIKPGARVWIDGSYGAFTPDRLPGQGFMLIGGGVGITPMRSILLTMRDREDVRPVTLIYAASSPERMIYLEELRALERALNLRCVLVYESPPPGWQGERGFVTAELLKRHLPRHALRHQYFVCGPEPMMDCVEKGLLELGIPPSRICTERFNMG